MCDPPKPAPDRLSYEAADEIERLRQKVESLRFLADHHRNIGEDLALARGDNERLRAALRQYACECDPTDSCIMDDDFQCGKTGRDALAGKVPDDAAT
jgi:hypothetical protein